MSQGPPPWPRPPTSQERASPGLLSLTLSHQNTLLGLTEAWPAQPGAGATPAQATLVMMG